jgi:hypothetical protein
MPLGPAQALDRPVGKGEVDLERGGARVTRWESKLAEQALGDPVVALVLDEGRSAARGKAGLPSVPQHEPQALEHRQVGERRGRAHFESARDVVERHAMLGILSRIDRLQGVDLAPSEPLKDLHASPSDTAYLW